ncbi:MAG: FAD-binding domain-containing protein [Pseudomonadota bacterium]
MTQTTLFPATRTAALERLSSFVPKAGRDYASRRNYDLPTANHPHVSQLSPYLRHRLLTEAEVVEAVLGRHSAATAEKFLQEVFWRTYWKGWLQMRPQVWGAYRSGLDKALAAIGRDNDLANVVAKAEAGETDIAAFNDWVEELVTTGYLHNHARMWFASIWTFTLRLPWEIGADFFLRHLLDGDPASNTLSWRWVAGLQTQGKHYLARSSNIAKYTEGRHNPEWRLNTQAAPLKGPAHPAPRPAPTTQMPDQGLRTGILLTEEDLSPGFVLSRLETPPVGYAMMIGTGGGSPIRSAEHVYHFALAALEDTASRWESRLGEGKGIGPTDDIEDIIDWALMERWEQVVTAYTPVGPTATLLAKLRKRLEDHGIRLVTVLRHWDEHAWPHATHGFFRFKSHIPDLIGDMSVE